MKNAGLTVEGVLTQLKRLNGNMAAVARHFGCTRQSVFCFCRDRKVLQQLQTDLRESKKDHAEDKLAEAIDRGEAWAICFFLKCQAKDRGYVEWMEQTGANGGPVALEMVEEIVDVHVHQVQAEPPAIHVDPPRLPPPEPVYLRSPRSGPHAQDIRAAPNGDTYTYSVPKFYRVVAVQLDHTIVVRTRRGRQRTLANPDASASSLLRGWVRHMSTPGGCWRNTMKL